MDLDMGNGSEKGVRIGSTGLGEAQQLKVGRTDTLQGGFRPVFEIFARYLPVKSLGRALCVCKAWKEVGSAEGMWHRHCALLYPALLSPSVSKQIAQTCGFYRFFRHRLLPPARAPPLPFKFEDLTFFLDISFHSSPIFSHVFRYEGGNAVVPYSADCYVDSGAVLPSSDALDKDSFRRLLSVNWTVVRRTDAKASCLVRSCPDRSSPSHISFESLLAAAPNDAKKPAPGSASSQVSSVVSATPINSPRPSLSSQQQAPGSQLPALKLVFNTTLGGALGEQFYGMKKITFSLPVKQRLLQSRVPPSASGATGAAADTIAPELVPVNVLSRSGGLELAISALKDRLGGTVRVDVAGKEFLLILSALQWA